MGLRESYSLLSSLYDPLVAPATLWMRRRSLEALGDVHGLDILLPGIGTGLDIPYLPPEARYIGIDVTPAMLERARRRADELGRKIDLQVADVQALPFADESFDRVVMHLILAVVPDTRAALCEARRVLRAGGRIIVLDKFLRPGPAAPFLRLMSPWLGRIATRTDVVFEQVLGECPELTVVSDVPALAGGWFRRIELQHGQ
jgi:ubiquinone/menaquinone biosynthesis C-methylase UbiE